MTLFLLATAVLLQSPVAEPSARLPAMGVDTPTSSVVATAVRSSVARDLEDSVHATVFPFGQDKAQHFLMSYGIATFAYAAGRGIGLDRGPALTGAMAGAVVAGAFKELIDSRSGGDPSFADFFADVLGAAAAYAMLRQVQ